jgi:hypothetical protein
LTVCTAHCAVLIEGVTEVTGLDGRAVLLQGATEATDLGLMADAKLLVCKSLC